MRYKPDWDEARRRLEALWQGRVQGRPCIAVHAPSGKGCKPPPVPQDLWRKWLDPEWVLADALAHLENTFWGGEAVPSCLLQSGWVGYIPGRPRFQENTIWFEPAEVDFESPPAFAYQPEHPIVRQYQAVYCAVAAAAGRDDFLLGQPGLLPACDLLSVQLGTERFLLALLDHPAWMTAALAQAAGALVEARNRLRDAVSAGHDYWYGNAGWMPFWGPRPYFATQADVSCMLSEEMFERFVLPELEMYWRQLGPLWYHLDGRHARHHLPRLLSLPYLRVVQYTPAPGEPPNGPAHLELYRQVQSAGKIVHVQLPKENVEPLVRTLDAALLMLDTACDSPAEAAELLSAAERWSTGGRA